MRTYRQSIGLNNKAINNRKCYPVSSPMTCCMYITKRMSNATVRRGGVLFYELIISEELSIAPYTRDFEGVLFAATINRPTFLGATSLDSKMLYTKQVSYQPVVSSWRSAPGWKLLSQNVETLPWDALYRQPEVAWQRYWVV